MSDPEMAQLDTQGESGGEFIRHKSPNFVHFYSNNAEFGTNVWDIRVIFSELLDTRDNRYILEQHATVVMSPLHAKAFAALMAQAVAQYEARFGEIKFPDAALEDETPPQEVEQAKAGVKGASKKRASKRGSKK